MSGLLVSGDKVQLDHAGAAAGMVGKVEAVWSDTWSDGLEPIQQTMVSVLVRIVVPAERITKVYRPADQLGGRGGVWETRT